MSRASYDPSRALRRRHGRATRAAGLLPPGRPSGVADDDVVEKFQVALLADRVEDLLDATGTRTTQPPAPDNDPLETPFDDDFRIVAMSVEWDTERELVHLRCHDRDPDDADADQDARAAGLPPEIQTVNVVIQPGTAQEFARRCKALVSAGRPPCPFCGGPLDPTGHICPRANGYRR